VTVNRGCTGTLITPTVVITAAHCVDAAVRSTEPWEHWENSTVEIGIGFNFDMPSDPGQGTVVRLSIADAYHAVP